MNITTLAQELDRAPTTVVWAMLNLIKKGLATPTTGTPEEAIADLEKRLGPNCYRFGDEYQTVHASHQGDATRLIDMIRDGRAVPVNKTPEKAIADLEEKLRTGRFS